MSRRSRQLTYYAPMRAVPEPPPEQRPGALWGYPVRRLDDLAHYAVRGHLQWWTAGDRADQKAAAWDGITDCLLAATARPSEHDLIRAGTHGIAAMVRGELRHHGAPHDSSVTGEKFGVYWSWAARVTASHEESVTDRLAVPVILATLSPRQREAVEALAAYGEYEAAAQAMGVRYATFHRHLSDARQRFRALWHEGETPPPGMWRQDRRANMERRTDEEVCGSPSGYNRHVKRREEACQACRDAANAYNRAAYAARKAAAGTEAA